MQSRLTSASWVAAVLLLCGCNPAAPLGLIVTDLRPDEDCVPLAFVIALHNDSDEAAEIRGVAVNVLKKTLISRPQDAGRIPEGFDYEVEFSPEHPTKVAANSEGVACGFLVWKLPPDAPPMMAVVTCEFRVTTNGETLATEPVTLVLQTRPGLLTAESVDTDIILAGEQARKVVAVLSKLPGKKSAGFDRLLRKFDAETGTDELR